MWALPHEYVIGYDLPLNWVKAKDVQLKDSIHTFSVIILVCLIHGIGQNTDN